MSYPRSPLGPATRPWPRLAAMIAGVALLLAYSGSTPAGALTYRCSPQTLFAVGPAGIFAVRPYVPSIALIKPLAGGTAISAGLGGDDLYVTVNNELMRLYLPTLTLTATGITVPADHNSLSEGLDGYLYLGTASGDLHLIDLGVMPRTIALVGSTVQFSGDLAMDPQMRPNWFTAAPLLYLRASVGLPVMSELAMVKKSNAGTMIFDFFHPAGLVFLVDPMEGLAYTADGELWSSDSRPALPEVLWHVVDQNTGLVVQQMNLEYHVTDLASEPALCGYDRPPIAHPPTGEHGDAPDSTSHFGSMPMTTYSGVQASFPTVWAPSTGLPYGPRHHSLGDAQLGGGANVEVDADLQGVADPDPMPNISPLTNQADMDGGDDGFATAIALPHCQATDAQFTTSVLGGLKDRYLSIWFDFNRDGDWQDTLSCTDPQTGTPRTIPERAVFNMAFSQGPGSYSLTTPTFYAYDPVPGGNVWMRATLTDHEIVSTDGRGLQYGYANGETEDYYLQHVQGVEYAP